MDNEIRDCQVTVLMSVFNDIQYLKQSIDSILNQTYSNFKYLIIDDGSTDGSDLIIKEYAKKDSRIEYIINQSNKGLGYCLNFGLKSIKTKYVARMDSDDMSLPNRLEIQMKFLYDNPDIDILGGYALDIGEDGTVKGERKLPCSNERIKKLIWTNPIIHPTVIFNRERITKIGSYRQEIKRRQDYELWFRAVAANYKFANIPIPLIYYRFTEDYYKKNSFKLQIDQFKIGWQGCRLVHAYPIAYIGLFAPIIKTLVPNFLKKYFNAFLNKIDPRKS